MCHTRFAEHGRFDAEIQKWCRCWNTKMNIITLCWIFVLFLSFSVYQSVCKKVKNSHGLHHVWFECLCVPGESCSRTWFPGGDSGTRWWRPRAGTVVHQNSYVVSSAWSKARNLGCWLHPSCSYSVCCCLPFVLPPVSDLRTHTTHGDLAFLILLCTLHKGQ